MKVSQHFTKDTQIPYILADDVLDEKFLPLLWDELNFLSRDLDTLEAALGRQYFSVGPHLAEKFCS